MGNTMSQKINEEMEQKIRKAAASNMKELSGELIKATGEGVSYGMFKAGVHSRDVSLSGYPLHEEDIVRRSQEHIKTKEIQRAFIRKCPK